MAIDNTESQMRKGLLELCVLGIIQRQKEAYPSDMLEQLKAAKLVVLEGTLYPLLSPGSRMEASSVTAGKSLYPARRASILL
jgi:DNA-binding PadR family transcriptional regulator